MRTSNISQSIRVVTFLLLACLGVSCDEDDPKPTEPDLFAGTWELASNPNISFTVKAHEDGYVFENVNVAYSQIPSDQTINNYEVDLYDPYADKDGFGQIKIHGGTDTYWIHFTLTHNKIVKYENSCSMFVYQIDIAAINRPDQQVKNLEFVKK
jgi:hypothetical protein